MRVILFSLPSYSWAKNNRLHCTARLLSVVWWFLKKNKKKNWTSSTTNSSILPYSFCPFSLSVCSIRRRRGNKRENHVNSFDCWLPVRVNHTPMPLLMHFASSPIKPNWVDFQIVIFCVCVFQLLAIDSTLYSHPSTSFFFLMYNTMLICSFQFKSNQRYNIEDGMNKIIWKTGLFNFFLLGFLCYFIHRDLG
jgi:hypothetical protein